MLSIEEGEERGFLEEGPHKTFPECHAEHTGYKAIQCLVTHVRKFALYPKRNEKLDLFVLRVRLNCLEMKE